MGTAGTTRVLSSLRSKSHVQVNNATMGRLFVYSNGLGPSEFGETSSLNIRWESCAVRKTWGLGHVAPLAVGKVQPRLRSFFNGNGQTNLTQLLRLAA